MCLGNEKAAETKSTLWLM